jgi:hypothetical protein
MILNEKLNFNIIEEFQTIRFLQYVIFTSRSLIRIRYSMVLIFYKSVFEKLRNSYKTIKYFKIKIDKSFRCSLL